MVDLAFGDSEFCHEIILLVSARLQGSVHAWIDATCISFVDLVAVFKTQVLRRLDVTLCVVKMMPRLGVDPAHCANHLAREQDIVYRNDPRQKIDAGLMVDAGIEEDVLEDMLMQLWLLERLRKSTVPPPVIRG